MWSMEGIESIIPITEYEEWDKRNTWNVLTDQPPVRNPLVSIIQSLLLRARYNANRRCEIYSIDCDESLTKEFWEEQWEKHPQETADLIRARGQQLYSDNINHSQQIIK